MADETWIPPPLPATWLRRLVEAMTGGAGEDGQRTLNELDASLDQLSKGALHPEDCRAFWREEQPVLSRYFELVASVIDSFGLPDPSAVAEEWSRMTDRSFRDEGVRGALRGAYARLTEFDAPLSGSAGPEIRAAIESLHGTLSPLREVLLRRSDLFVAMLLGRHIPAEKVSAYRSLLVDLSNGYDQARGECLTSLYLSLGRWKGGGVRPAERAIWGLFGGSAIRDVLDRARPETDLDRLDAISEWLIERWPESAGATLAALGEVMSSAVDAQLKLLIVRALRWVDPSALAPRIERTLFERLLLAAISGDDADVREAAARALVAWLGAEAAEPLRMRLSVEPDDDVREALLELFASVASESAA
ncbi:MAG: HEAT repeat domain-containing protein [Polyangiales bacterium]